MKKTCCQEALSLWGYENQINKALEELAELSLALHHYKDGKVKEEAVVDEIADVKIMIEQLSIIFGVDTVNVRETKKLLKLKKIITDYKERNA